MIQLKKCPKQLYTTEGGSIVISYCSLMPLDTLHHNRSQNYEKKKP